MILLCEPSKGETLGAAIGKALDLAKKNQVDVKFTFDGVAVRVSHLDTLQKASARAAAAQRISKSKGDRP